jgi:hypothetical protein
MRFLSLLMVLFAFTAFAQNKGDVVSRSELLREIPSDQLHPIARKLLAVHEADIACEPAPQTILVAHFRAEPTAPLSMNDDRVIIAIKQKENFRILEVLESDTLWLRASLRRIETSTTNLF